MNKSFWSLYLIPLLALSISLNAQDAVSSASTDTAVAAKHKHKNKGKGKHKKAVQAEAAAPAADEEVKGKGRGKRKHHEDKDKDADKGSKAKRHHHGEEKEHHEGEKHGNDDGEHHGSWWDKFDPTKFNIVAFEPVRLTSGDIYFSATVWTQAAGDATKNAKLLKSFTGLHYDAANNKVEGTAGIPEALISGLNDPKELNMLKTAFESLVAVKAEWIDDSSLHLTFPTVDDPNAPVFAKQLSGQTTQLDKISLEISPYNLSVHFIAQLPGEKDGISVCYSAREHRFFNVDQGIPMNFPGEHTAQQLFIEKFPELSEAINHSYAHGHHDEHGEHHREHGEHHGDHEMDHKNHDNKDSKGKKGGEHKKEMKHKKGAEKEGAEEKPEHKKRGKKAKKSEKAA